MLCELKKIKVLYRMITHINSVYSGGVPLITRVYSYVNEVNTKEKIYIDIYFIIWK